MAEALEALKAKFKGKTIAIQVATIQADFLGKYLADVATIRTYQSGPETFADLLNDRGDVVMALRTNFNAYVLREKTCGCHKQHRLWFLWWCAWTGIGDCYPEKSSETESGAQYRRLNRND